jgi:arsenate reductase (thioredoxin)
MKGGETVKILFLCTGNSARSQMAEAWVRTLKGDALEPWSAGILAHGVHPLTVEVMKEAGIDISGQRSKTVTELLKKNIEVDYVVTLCDEASASCPFFPAQAKVIHRGFRDPVRAEGTHEERLKLFREVRDEIRSFVETMPESLENTSAIPPITLEHLRLRRSGED